MTLNFVPEALRGTACSALSLWGSKTATGDTITVRLLDWNLGTQYYRSGDYAKALDYFRISIQGGIGQDGAVVRGIPLSYDNRVPELYYMYGLILARSGQCQEAAEVVRLLTQGVPDDATAVLNAEYMTEVCKEGDFDIVLISVPTETPAPAGEGEEDLQLENSNREE